MAITALRHLQRALRRSSSLSCSSLQSVLFSGSEVSSRPSRGEFTAPFPSNSVSVSRASVAAYSSSRSAVHNYDTDVHSYNNLISQINIKRRHYLSRDVYQDMLLDGVQPMRDTFYLLISGCMQSARLQDVMFFFEEMKTMGITPDVSMYNCIIAACGRSQQIDRAFQVAEEMEAFGIQPKHRTFLALLRACAVAGRLDEAYGVVRRMAAYGLTLDNHCYAALITAHKNNKPQHEETVQKVFELLEQSKYQSTAGLDAMAIAATGEAESADDSEDWLLSFMSGDDQSKRGFINRRLTAYHAALSAFQDLGNLEAVKKVVELIEKDGHAPDAYCTKQLIKCHIAEGEFEKACAEYNKFLENGRRPTLDLYLILIDAALSAPSPANSAVAQKLLNELVQRGFFLNLTLSGELMMKACQDKTRDVAVANMIWDMSENRGFRLPIKFTREYYRALEKSDTSKDDPRLTQIRSLVEEHRRSGKGSPSAEAVQHGAGISRASPGNAEGDTFGAGGSQEASVPGKVEELPQAHSEEASDTVPPQAVQQ